MSRSRGSETANIARCALLEERDAAIKLEFVIENHSYSLATKTGVKNLRMPHVLPTLEEIKSQTKSLCITQFKY